MTGPLLGRVAVVTGASSGIGAAVAIRLCAGGATVIGVGRDKARLADVADTVAEDGFGRFETAVLDLTDDVALASFTAETPARHPGLNTLVHSAGGYASGPLASASLDDLDAQYAANVRAPYALTQGLLPALRAPRPGGSRGDVIVVNSSQGVRAGAGTGQFAATQHAMRAIADSLRQEVNDDGIRVCSIHLGRTATPRQRAIHARDGRDYRPDLLVQPADVAEVVAGILTLAAGAEITEIHLRPARKSY